MRQLEFELANSEHVSSVGIRQFVAAHTAHKKMDGNLVVRNVSPEVWEVLRLTGVGNRLNFA